ncbi:MAG: LysR family transcriptional activator of nhaA [Planctomycetota bacterium]|jgi:LysR family transcriptional activator of nhaA
MEWLNYHHLLYFWTVAHEGGIAAASRKLGVGRPAISMQMKSLEGFIGSSLFTRRGKHLTLTETGEMVLRYADDIFHTGRELVDAVRGRPLGRPRRFRVGIADVMAKLVAFQLLLPAVDADEDTILECREDEPNRLFAELAVHELDLVLSDIPVAPGLDVRAYNHVMGESTTTLFATPAIARKLKSKFPSSLSGAPFLMPSKASAIRHSLEQWLQQKDLRPTVIGEFEDGALMKVFGQAGRGVFPAPTVVKDQICKNYNVRPLGELTDVRERFYAISPERKIRHPGVARIVESAKSGIFAG